MPDQLKVRSAERVDLVDYVHGANEYTQEQQKFLLEREMIDRRSRVLDGFRVRIEDQTANPGMITIFNGNALDRSGQIINNEQAVNDSRSITLLGTGLNFYVEIEFIENESAVDARYFWDPTVANVAPEPNGSEVGRNITTRLTPDWRVVNPVSTTSFQQTATPSSIRVPIGVFRTDGSNRIVTGGTNPGLTLVRAATILETDIASAVTSFRVVDARILPATTPFNVTLDFGGTSPEAMTVSGVDRDNGIVSLTAPTASSHLAGAIVRVTSGTADLVRENIDPSNPTFNPLLSPPGHPDPSQRLWQAHEVRGSGLINSKETFGARDDLNIRALKDYIDYVSAQVREIKFGSPRPDVVSTAPPATFATRPRWFDRAGSILGARSNSVSIGNGTTTFGDFNGTDGSALLTAAMAALPAGGGKIFVKAGTYNFATAVNVAKPVVVEGEHYGSTILNVTNAGGAGISTTANIRFRNITVQRAGGAAINTIDCTGAVTLNFDYSVFTGQIRLVAINAAVVGTSSSFVASASQPVFLGTTAASTLTSAKFTGCVLSTGGILATCAVNGLVFDNCSVTAAAVLTTLAGACNVTDLRAAKTTFTVGVLVVTTNTTTGFVTDVDFSRNRITSISLGSDQALFYLANTGTIDRVNVCRNYINITGGTTTLADPGYVLFIENNTSTTGLSVSHNQVDAPLSSFILPVSIDQDILTGDCHVANNYFYRTLGAVRVGGAVGTVSVGALSVCDNIHDDAGQHSTVTGVALVSNGFLEHFDICGNVFMNYTSSAAGDRIGVDLSTDSVTGGMRVRIIDNKFLYIANLGGVGASYGVLYDVSTASPMEHSWVVQDNLFSRVAGTTTSAAVWLATSSTSAMNARVCNNQLCFIGEDATSSLTLGVYCENFGSNLGTSLQIKDNNIYQVVSSAGNSPSTGIEVSSCLEAQVSGNHIASIRSDSTDSVSENGCAIRAYGSSLDGLVIERNIIDQSLAATPSEAQLGIVLQTTDTVSGWTIRGNYIRTSSVGYSAIWVSSPNGTEGYVDGKIVDNVIRFESTQAGVFALYCQLGGPSHGIKVDDNTVEEITYDASCASHSGIVVEADNDGGDPYSISVSDNILSGPKSGALVASVSRSGIWLRGALRNTKVNSNIVDWNEVGVLRGRGIRYSDDITVASGPWPGHICSGNIVRGDNSAAAGGEVDIDTAFFTDGFLFGNVLGVTAAVGTIVPPAAAGGWDYGTVTNKLS